MNDQLIDEEMDRLPPDEIKRGIEAILFASGEPVSYDRLAAVFALSPGEIKKLAAEMVPTFDGRGIKLLCFDTACQLCTAEEFEEQIRDALGIRKNGALSNSCLEALAVIAYNQPVTRAYIEQVRGVDSSYAIGVLLTRELIEIKGKLEVPGRPNLYVTTKNFLRVFGLSSLDELPVPSLLEVDGTDGNDAENGGEEQILMDI